VVEIDPEAITSCGHGSCMKNWIELWSDKAAYAYPAFTADANGDIGGVTLYGGGDYLPGCAAILSPAGADPETPWLPPVSIADSEVGTPDARWGDYLGISLETDGTTFAGTCMSVHPKGQNQVHVVRFAAPDAQQ